MTYEETISSLLEILKQANAADSDNAKSWQHRNDASGIDGVYHHITKAIEILAGGEIIEHWADTMEVDLTLCNRSK